jgi:hypothetical protein
VPLYIGARAVGLTGSIWGMVVLYTGMLLPLSIFLYAGFFRGMNPFGAGDRAAFGTFVDLFSTHKRVVDASVHAAHDHPMF